MSQSREGMIRLGRGKLLYIEMCLPPKSVQKSNKEFLGKRNSCWKTESISDHLFIFCLLSFQAQNSVYTFKNILCKDLLC